MKKYLFDLPPRDHARKPYAAGLPPEVDAWAKANKHRIGTYRSWCRPQYSVFIGNVDMLQELCNLYDDYGFIAYGNTKGVAVQQLYNNLQMRKAARRLNALRMRHVWNKPWIPIDDKGRALKYTADAAGENTDVNPHNSLENAPAQVGETLADGKEGK